MKLPLTKKQKETLDYLKYYKRRYRIMPTVQEIANNYKITISSAWERLFRLQNKNWIIRENSNSWIKFI